MKNQTIDNFDNGWEYEEETGHYSIDFPSGPFNESIVYPFFINWKTMGLLLTQNYSFPHYIINESNRESNEFVVNGHIEISNDNGGTWEIISELHGETPYDWREFYNFPFNNNEKLVRFRVEGRGNQNDSSKPIGHWQIWEIDLIGENNEGEPPRTSISITGFFKYWVQRKTFSFSCYDNIKVKELHLIIDGKENISEINRFSLYIKENGHHVVKYWAVDITGNEEHPKVLRFGVDNEPPVVKIIEPSNGLYFFGRKILDIPEIILIGYFPIEVYAYDNISGILKIEISLNDWVIAGTCNEHYKGYCGERYMGPAKLNIIVLDGDWSNQNWVSKSLDVLYYKYYSQ